MLDWKAFLSSPVATKQLKTQCELSLGGYETTLELNLYDRYVRGELNLQIQILSASFVYASPQ